jgi:hypothetical protein
MILPNASCTDVVCPKCKADVDMVCSPGDGVVHEGQPHEARVAFASTVRANAASREALPRGCIRCEALEPLAEAKRIVKELREE